jgi:hypothetical protein
MGKQLKCFCFPRMNNLSPAAQAVFNAADSVFDEAGTTSQGIAAALRAALDEVLPAFRSSRPKVIDEKHRKVDAATVRYLMLDIVNELEAQAND